MKVADLIHLLQSLPPDLPVYVPGYRGHDPVDEVRETYLFLAGGAGLCVAQERPDCPPEGGFKAVVLESQF